MKHTGINNTLTTIQPAGGAISAKSAKCRLVGGEDTQVFIETEEKPQLPLVLKEAPGDQKLRGSLLLFFLPATKMTGPYSSSFSHC